MPSTWAISFIIKQFNPKYFPILKISMYLSFLIPIPNQLQIKFSITNTCCRISILTTSSLNMLIAPVIVPHSVIIRLATLLLVTLTLSITLLFEMHYPKARNIVSLNPSIGNTTSKYWLIQSSIMSGNGLNARKKTNNELRLRGRCYITNATPMLHQSLKTHETKCCKTPVHDKYVVVPADKAQNNIVLCVNHMT